MKESVLLMTLVFGLSVLSYFLTQTEKERSIASGKTQTSVQRKVPVGYQK